MEIFSVLFSQFILPRVFTSWWKPTSNLFTIPSTAVRLFRCAIQALAQSARMLHAIALASFAFLSKLFDHVIVAGLQKSFTLNFVYAHHTQSREMEVQAKVHCYPYFGLARIHLAYDLYSCMFGNLEVAGHENCFFGPQNLFKYFHYFTQWNLGYDLIH